MIDRRDLLKFGTALPALAFIPDANLGNPVRSISVDRDPIAHYVSLWDGEREEKGCTQALIGAGIAEFWIERQAIWDGPAQREWRRGDWRLKLNSDAPGWARDEWRSLFGDVAEIKV